jgi:hypothetical protein
MIKNAFQTSFNTFDFIKIIDLTKYMPIDINTNISSMRNFSRNFTNKQHEKFSEKLPDQKAVVHFLITKMKPHHMPM